MHEVAIISGQIFHGYFVYDLHCGPKLFLKIPDGVLLLFPNTLDPFSSMSRLSVSELKLTVLKAQ
jgi:hypothetical protein